MSDAERPSPAKLADFEISRRLGVGGMAEVFLAKKRGAEGTYKQLVVKRILPSHTSSQRFRAMFAEEAQLATRLNHPNIVQVYDFQDYGEEGQLLSMEYVEGPDLRELQRAAHQQDTRLPPYIAAYIVAEVAKGLHYAHERKDEGGKPLEIVHRDVSPQNVLLSFDGGVKIADFGIATANVFRQETGVLKGKTGYMSPEQARGEKVDRRTDIYSLGVVFHELLTGRPLHGQVEGKELLEAVRVGTVEPPSLYVRGIPAELEAIVMQALSVERDKRFQTARDFAGAITRVLFQKQQLVDAQALEGAIAQFIHRTPDDRDAEATGGSLGGGSALDLPPAASSTGSESQSQTGTGPVHPRFRGRAGREVRHVAIVGLRILGQEEMDEAMGKAQTARFSEQLRRTLNEIAYKRGAQWIWRTDDPSTQAGHSDPASVVEVSRAEVTGEGTRGAIEEIRPNAARLGESEREPADPSQLVTAQAVVGLLANPSRAASDAAWLAIDVHEALEGACDGLPARLRASVSIVRGIAEGRRDRAGHLTHYTLQAPAGALARRLRERAEEGKTWAAGGIYRLVRREFVWSELPPVALSGDGSLPPSMRVYELSRPLTRQEKRQQQSLAPRDLVGRDAELADLHAAYHQAVSPGPNGGAGQVTSRVVIGEMGIGKTALVTTFLGELPPDCRELRVECSPYRNEMPFSSAGQWLRELTGIRIDEPVEQARATILDVMGDLADRENSAELIKRMSDLATGRLAEAADEAEAALHRRLLTTGIRHFFARAAAHSPLVVTVDGLQWIDMPSLELLMALLKRTDSLPILLLLVTRPDERIISYLDGIVRIELSRLSAENQVRLVEAHIGATEGVLEACGDLIPRAAGNPFFLLEMVDALLERGNLDLTEDDDGQVVLVRNENAQDSEHPLPSTLEQLIADRLNELPPEERAVIDWLSVAGGPLKMKELSALLETEADEPVARLCARGLCDTKGETVDVRHPLTRDVAYMALPKEEVSYMHQRLGERMARTPLATGLSAAMVARHFAKGRQPEAAADYFLSAASVARSSYQLPLATRYYQQALEVLPDMDERRLEPYSVLEDICRVQGRWKDRKRYLEALRDCAVHSGKGVWIATALIRHAQFDFDGGHLNAALRLAQYGEEVALHTGSRTLQVQAQSLLTEILRDLGEMQGALAACERALRTVVHPDVAPRVRAEVLRTRATLLLRAGRVQEALQAHAEAIAVFRKAQARRHEARAKSSLAFAMYVTGQFEDAIALAFEAIRIDLSIGGRFQIAKTLSNIGQCYTRLGDYTRAASYFRRAREAHERYEDQDSRADTLLCSAELCLELNELTKAEGYLTEAESLSDPGGNSYEAVHAKLLRAVIARRRGHSSSSVVYAFDARQVAETQAYLSFHFFAMALEAAARVDVGEHHTGVLLATTTLGAIETVQGSEYGLETRVLCLEALEKTNSPQIDEMRLRTARYVGQLAEQIRDPDLRRSFAQRNVVVRLLSDRVEQAPSG